MLFIKIDLIRVNKWMEAQKKKKKKKAWMKTQQTLRKERREKNKSER